MNGCSYILFCAFSYEVSLKRCNWRDACGSGLKSVTKSLKTVTKSQKVVTQKFVNSRDADGSGQHLATLSFVTANQKELRRTFMMIIIINVFNIIVFVIIVSIFIVTLLWDQA